MGLSLTLPRYIVQMRWRSRRESAGGSAPRPRVLSSTLDVNVPIPVKSAGWSGANQPPPFVPSERSDVSSFQLSVFDNICSGITFLMDSPFMMSRVEQSRVTRRHKAPSGGRWRGPLGARDFVRGPVPPLHSGRTHHFFDCAGTREEAVLCSQNVTIR